MNQQKPLLRSQEYLQEECKEKPFGRYILLHTKFETFLLNCFGDRLQTINLGDDFIQILKYLMPNVPLAKFGIIKKLMQLQNSFRNRGLSNDTDAKRFQQNNQFKRLNKLICTYNHVMIIGCHNHTHTRRSRTKQGVLKCEYIQQNYENPQNSHLKISQPYSHIHILIFTTHRDATIHRLEGLFTPFMEFSKYFNAYEEIRTHLSNNKHEISFFHFPLLESLNALNAIPLYT